MKVMSRQASARRNAEIYRILTSGEHDVRWVANTYGVSVARVYQIMRSQRDKRGDGTADVVTLSHPVSEGSGRFTDGSGLRLVEPSGPRIDLGEEPVGATWAETVATEELLKVLQDRLSQRGMKLELVIRS